MKDILRAEGLGRGRDVCAVRCSLFVGELCWLGFVLVGESRD